MLSSTTLTLSKETWQSITLLYALDSPIPAVARSKGGSAVARLLRVRVRIPPEVWMSVPCECCVLSGRGPCDGPIIRPEDSHRVRCVWMRSWSPDYEALVYWGLFRHGKNNVLDSWNFKIAVVWMLTAISALRRCYITILIMFGVTSPRCRFTYETKRVSKIHQCIQLRHSKITKQQISSFKVLIFEYIHLPSGGKTGHQFKKSLFFS